MENTIKLNPLFKIYFLTLIILKLDNKLDISWMLIFAPILAVWVMEAIIPVIMTTCNTIVNIISNIKRNQEINTRYNGQKLYWDATNKRMYGPFEIED